MCSPASPSLMDWSSYYPAFVKTENRTSLDPDADPELGVEEVKPMIKEVEVADIGCGFGGLLVALAPRFPDTLMIGMQN